MHAIRPKSPAPVAISAIDLFCGAGGLTCGLVQAGVKVLAGVDVDPACKFPYEKNNEAEFILKSVREIKGDDLLAKLPQKGFKLLAGCAPCQTFSTYNQKASSEDPRWNLLGEFQRLAQEMEPDFITMENVPGLKEQEVFTLFVKSLEELKYTVWNEVVDCSQYGLPQQRNRLVLIASRLGKVKLLSPKELGCGVVTVAEAIGRLPSLEAGQTHPQDPLHTSSRLSELNLRRIQHSRPGGTWRDWPKDLVAECHRKLSGKTYPSVYGRMVWNKPSPTMTTQFFGFGNGRFGHPDVNQNRAISLREGAILQSFPLDYQFIPPGKEVNIKSLGRMIGNAVPVQLGKVIGQSLLKHAEAHAAKTARKDRKHVPS